MRPITGDEFEDLTRNFQASAFRLEQQPEYAVDLEAEQFAAFRAGNPQDPTLMDGFTEWLDLVRDHTNDGRRVERVRVQDEPPTDYQRWERWVGEWNIKAGEVIHYATRSRAREVGLLPDAGDADWWLIDDRHLIVMRFGPDHASTPYITTDEPDLTRARAWRDLALSAASG